MTFKEMVATDVSRHFLNLDEFAEEHEIEGVTIAAVIDETTIGESKKGEQIGLAQYDLTIYAKAEDLPAPRAAGESLNVDGKECTVVSWGVDAGMATIYLAHQIGG